MKKRKGWPKRYWKGAHILGYSHGKDKSKGRCKRCGRSDGIFFEVSDSDWITVVPVDFLDKHLCLTCFDKLAYAKNYAYTLLSISFDGLMYQCRVVNN